MAATIGGRCPKYNSGERKFPRGTELASHRDAKGWFDGGARPPGGFGAAASINLPGGQVRPIRPPAGALVAGSYFDCHGVRLRGVGRDEKDKGAENESDEDHETNGRAARGSAR